MYLYLCTLLERFGYSLFQKQMQTKCKHSQVYIYTTAHLSCKCDLTRSTMLTQANNRLLFINVQHLYTSATFYNPPVRANVRIAFAEQFWHSVLSKYSRAREKSMRVYLPSRSAIVKYLRMHTNEYQNHSTSPPKHTT